MFREKKISIIVPCYNTEKYIDECLESIVNQTIGMDNIQLIIIDDASTDDSLAHILRYAEKYPNSVCVEYLEENSGQANARNRGIDLAEAPYLVFVDSDDWISLDFCEKMLRFADGNCDLIYCGYMEYWKGKLEPASSNISSELYNEIISIYLSEEKKRFLKNNRISRIIGCAVLRTEWLRENKIRFKNYRKYEDNYFAGIICYKFNSYCAIPENLYFYRILNNSNSHARNDNRHFERLKVEVDKVVYYQEQGLFDIYYEEIRRDFLSLFYRNTLHIMFTQFDEIPIDIIEVMQQTVKELFPDYLETIIYEDLVNDIILTLYFKLSLERWEELKYAYLKMVVEDKPEQWLMISRSMWYSVGMNLIEREKQYLKIIESLKKE